VVVSSEIPFKFLVNLENLSLSFFKDSFISLNNSTASSEFYLVSSGSSPVSLNFFSAAKPSISKMVASPPSSTI